VWSFLLRFIKWSKSLQSDLVLNQITLDFKMKCSNQQLCQYTLLSGRNVYSPCRMLPPGETQRVCRRDRQTDGRQTVTLRFPLDAASAVVYRNMPRCEVERFVCSDANPVVADKQITSWPIWKTSRDWSA